MKSIKSLRENPWFRNGKSVEVPLKIKVEFTEVLNGLITVCRTIQDSILKTPLRRFRPGMTDDRVCCENIAGGNVCNCERDEGRPLVTVLQEMVANQCMLLCLRDKVVSDTPKGDVNRQVTVQEMTARELLMKHRKLFRRCQNRVFSVRPGINPEGTCLRSGWHPVQR